MIFSFFMFWASPKPQWSSFIKTRSQRNTTRCLTLTWLMATTDPRKSSVQLMSSAIKLSTSSSLTGISALSRTAQTTQPTMLNGRVNPGTWIIERWGWALNKLCSSHFEGMGCKYGKSWSHPKIQSIPALLIRAVVGSLHSCQEACHCPENKDF